MNDIPAMFSGELVRLVALEPGQAAEKFAAWSRDSDYARLMDSEPARLWSTRAIKDWISNELQESLSNAFLFMIQAVADDRLVGFIELEGIQWTHGEAWVGIGIGARSDWGKGFGSEAMSLILGYAFQELNLFRVSLSVFEYNQRAIRSYEKNGFLLEGKERAALLRDGKRWDLWIMGLLRDEWKGGRYGDPDP